MNTRTFALLLGIVFLLVGILGFVPAALTADPMGGHDGHHLRVAGYGEGYLLGLFHVNWIHSALHILFGVWGIAASRTGGSVIYARSVAVIYAVLAIFGLIPALNTVFGLVPIHGHDVWLHAGIAIVSAMFGWSPGLRGPDGTAATTNDVATPRV